MITVYSREEYLQEVKNNLPSNPMCVELGVLYGDFSEMILTILDPSLLLLIDPFESNEEKYSSGLSTAYSTVYDYDNLIKKFSDQKNVCILMAYSYNVVKWIPDNSISFLYHDASHLYKDLKRDLNEWLPKLKLNGIMCGHDYIDDPDFGVIQAVDEFCKEHDFEMIILNENGGDWALQKNKIKE